METAIKLGTEEAAARPPEIEAWQDRPSSNGQAPARADALPVDWEGLARASAHPLRVSILEVLGIDGGRVLSPNDLSHELQIKLGNINYHVTELAKASLIELLRTAPVRGAVEHFYRLPAVR